MTKFKYINKLLIIFCVCNIQCSRTEEVAEDEGQILIIVSYDAFRNEYFQRGLTSYINQQRQENTYAEYVRNVFPTKTMPNHFSISTGLYPGEHGVISNHVFDLKLNKTLEYGYDLFHYKKDIEPIWTLNQKYPNHYSGCMMWPGSNFEYNNITCKFSVTFDPSVDHYQRVDQAISWILNKKTPANLVLIYVEEPDLHAHAFGTDSQIINDMLDRLDKLTKYLDDKIKENKLETRTNVVHLSDHGMLNVIPKNFINLTDIIKDFKYLRIGTSPVIEIFPENPEDTKAMYKAIQGEAKLGNLFNVYMYDALPDRWHYNNKDRTAPITVVANPDYAFDDMWANIANYEKIYNITIKDTNKYGIHGYDNNLEIMNSMFYASGPSIKKNNKVDPFNTVDLMYLFCEILKLDPPDGISGNRQNILSILANQPESQKLSAFLVAVGSFLSSIILVGGIATILILHKRHKATQVPQFLYEENDITFLEEQKLLHPSATSINTSSDDVDINI